MKFFFIFWVGRYFDRFILEKYISLEDVAVFGLLMTFAGLVTMASQALANSIQPFLFESYRNLANSTKRINDLLLFYVGMLTLFCSFLITIVSNIDLLSPKEKYLEIIPFFYWAIIPSILNAFQYVFFNVFTCFLY